MSKYEKYMESEFVGIGKVPTHWEVKRLKHLGEAIIGLTYSPNDVTENEEGILVLRSSNIQEGFIAFDDCVYVNKEVNENLITRKGDILICARNGSAHLVGKNICIDEISAGHTFGAFMVVFRGKYWRYLSYFFNSPIFTSQTGMFSTTTINQLTSQTLNNLRIAYPSDKTEQDNICNYLDDQTQKIDRLIANKKAQAEKLKELRQIEINNAVTKGLNPNAEMKDSGIEWLGKIPKQWAEKRLKNLVSPKITDGPHETPELVDDLDGIPFISAEAITETGINYEARGGNISVEQDRIYSLKCKPKRDDIFMVKSGSTTGRIGYVDSDLNFNIWSPLALIRANSNTHSRFLYFALCSNYIQKQVQLTWSFGTQPNIGMGVIERLRLVIPPKDEQIVIANYLIQRTTAIDQLIKNIEAQIEKLQELRKIKIYEAVTGKIKVNAYAETTA